MMLMSFLEKHFHKQRTSPTKKGERVCAGPEPSPGDDPQNVKTSSSGPAADMDVDSTLDDYETALAQKSQRDSQLNWTLGLVAASVVCGWVLGTTGLSTAWLLLLLALVATVWRASIVRLVAATVDYETLRVRRRRALSQDETAEWFNFLVNRWWVFSSGSLFNILKEHLEPLLNEAKPSIVESMELHQFTLGEQTPFVRSVRAFDLTHGKRVPLSVRTLQQPPTGLTVSPHHQVALEAAVSLNSDDFCMVLKTRLFGRGVGVDLDLAVEKLNISGRIYVTLTLNMEAPFPHITHLTVTFLDKPEVWFNVRILKSVQMMEVPLLKTWIHSLVMDALVTSLVDPGKLDINLTPHDRPTPSQDTGDTMVQGVVTVTMSTTQPGQACEDVRWLVLTMGDQRCRTSHLSPRWQESPSFLVGSLQTDLLVVKLKSKRFVSSITIAQFELQLATFNLDATHVVETVLHKKMVRGSSNIPHIALRLEYTPVSTVQLDQSETLLSTLDGSVPVSGVLFVYIHGAEGLSNGDQGNCNPYCMLFNKCKKVKTTHYMRGVTSPQWESRAQFLVTDYTQVSLSFVVCSWSPNKMADTDLLGLANLNMTSNETCVVRKQLALNGNSSDAHITVSLAFRPVASVAQSGPCYRDNAVPSSEDDEISSFYRGGKRNSNTWMQQAKMLLTHRDQDSSTADISNLLSNGQGLMEVSLIRARDLVSKDLNGFSDPYCELKVNGECKYKSSVKKKTLNPNWEETSIMGIPRAGETLDVVLWDHDTFGTNDFLGSVTLTLEDIRHFSSLDTAQCCQLQGVKTGVVELKVKVISEEPESQSVPSLHNGSSGSPRIGLRHEELQSSRRPSGERSKLRLGENIPPPAPPRTVTLGYKLSANDDGEGVSAPRTSPAQSPVPLVTVTDLHATTGLDPRTTNGHHSLTPSPDTSFKKTPEYSSFRVMKQKVKRGLKLRRFRSEVSVAEDKRVVNGTSVAMSLEPSGGGESDATELLHLQGLSHAVSQPNILQIKQASPRLKRPTELKVAAPLRPDRYFGVEGKVIQAQGLHVAHVAQLYCRVKLHRSGFGACWWRGRCSCLVNDKSRVRMPGSAFFANVIHGFPSQKCATSPDKLARVTNNAGGKTLAKSRLLPAMPNPKFDLGFQLDHPDSVPRQASLVFEVRSSGKEVLGSCRVALQELLSAASPDTNEVHTWLSLNNGASLEVEIAHGRQLKRPGRKIFRSWSVHRIGKI